MIIFLQGKTRNIRFIHRHYYYYYYYYTAAAIEPIVPTNIPYLGNVSNKYYLKKYKYFIGIVYIGTYVCVYSSIYIQLRLGFQYTLYFSLVFICYNPSLRRLEYGSIEF